MIFAMWWEETFIVPADKQTERTHEPKGNIYIPYKI